MSFFSIFYTIIIYPIQLLLECCYMIFSAILDGIHGSEGIAVILLSFVVTLLTIPLYIVAESWAEKERLTQEKMAVRLAKIKKAFKGDERYMMQSEYYRQNNYHPLMALRSSFSILIQVPFFLAAYNFLSHLESLKGVSFLFIKDFGSPDATLKIGSLAINILPILMTLINCISGFVYSKGHPLREKLQIYGLALIFLVILYNSPSGLVVYWTMNNILSLVKNIFYKLKNPKKVLYIVCCIVAAIFIISVFTVLSKTKTIYKLAVILFALLLTMTPLIIKAFNFLIADRFIVLEKNGALRLAIFLLSAIGIAVLSGLVIPSTLMQSEPEQFSYIDGYTTPFVFLRAPFIQSLGLFLFWPVCFYALFSVKTKKTMAILSSFLLILAVVNCFVFSGNYGPIEPTLLFMESQYFTNARLTFISMAAAIVLLMAFVLTLHFKAGLLAAVSTIFIMAFGILSIKNCVSIGRAFKNMTPPVTLERAEPIYHLSRNGKNVIVVMQDRLISAKIPEILEERPDLRERLDGFIYYPNTTSFGTLTMFGTPGLFGGYDYTPWQINHTPEKTLQQKHNEALLTMPLIFLGENQNENAINGGGYNVTVSDLPYENYLEQPVSQIYEDYPKINRLSVQGSVSDIWYKRNNYERTNYVSKCALRNFLLFSIFKMATPAVRRIIYQDGYWSSDTANKDETSFINNYSQLDLLDELFDGESEKNSFIMIVNEMTHEPALLQLPDYTPSKNIDNSIFKNVDRNNIQDTDYHINACALLRWAEFFDYLREQNLYDNTRIIIVSDHGSHGKSKIYKESGKLPFRIQRMSASLLVKDFNAHGAIKTDMSFMTNADTPYLATKGLIENARNPFTGSPVKMDDEDDKLEKTIVMVAPAVSTRVRHKTEWKVDGYYKVNGSIFDENNWTKIDSAETTR